MQRDSQEHSVLPSQVPEFQKHSPLRFFLQNRLDMQVCDVRAMLKLPRSRVEPGAGCNLAAAGTICDLFCGISCVLFVPSNDVRGREKRSYDAKERRETNVEYSRRFHELMERYYPWATDEDPKENTDFLFRDVRSPLTHALGLWQGRQTQVVIRKKRLSDRQIKELEESVSRPRLAPRTIEDTRAERSVYVSALYWGLFQVLRKLAADEEQMSGAIGRLRQYGWLATD